MFLQKKLNFLIIFICFSQFFAFAEESKNINFGCSFATGFNAGKTQEFVYYKSGDVMSRLDWTTYFSPVIQISGNLNIYHAILEGDYTTVIPLKCGIVEDWDWLASDHSKATNYSKSDVTVNKDYQFNFKTGYEFLYKNWRFLPEIGFKYRNLKYEANYGYYQYGSVDTRNDGYWASWLKKYDLYGTVMTYEQQFYMPYVYLDAEYTFCKNWTAKLYGSYIPWIKCDTIDFHCADKDKLVQYNDFMKKGYGFTVGTAIQYKKFLLSFEYEWISGGSGHTTVRDIESTSNFSEADTKPGAEDSTFTVKAAWKIK